MAVTFRAAQSNTGPRAGTSWTSPLEALADLPTILLANASQSQATGGALTSENIVFVAPQVSTVTVNGTQQDALASDNIIANINKMYLGVGGVALTVTQANLTIQLFLRRAGAVVGGGAFAGWGLAGNVAIPAFSVVNIPFLTTNTALVSVDGSTKTPTNVVLPVQPFDVVTFSMVAAANITIPNFFVGIDAS